MKIYIIVIIWLSLVCVSADVVKAPSPLNWFTASKRCTTDGKQMEYNISVLSSLTRLKNKMFWIGKITYLKLLPWIEPKGCYKHNTPVESRYSKESVGSCQQHCQSSNYFSYKESTMECWCIHDAIFSTLEATNYSKCNDSSFKNDTILIYQVLSALNLNGGKETCMVLNCTGTGAKRVARGCNSISTKIKTVCESYHFEPKPAWNLDYDTSKKACENMDKKLLSPTLDICTQSLSGISFWTSAFREAVKVEYFEEQSGLTPDSCLSGTMDESSLITENNKDCTNNLSYFVCRSVNDIGTKYPSQEITSLSVTGYTDTDPDQIGTTTDTIPDIEPPTTGLLVGGIVGGIIIIVSTLLVILLIRKKQNAQASKTNLTKPAITVSNMQYDLAETIPNSLLTGNNNVAQKADYLYSLQNQTSPQYSQVDFNRHSSNNDVYNTASEGEYDKLNNILARQIKHETNLYGITGHCGEGEYDTMKGASQKKRTEDLYDTNVPVYGGNRDSTYDTANSFQPRQIDRNSTYGYSP